jgi:hypothetical protein
MSEIQHVVKRNGRSVVIIKIMALPSPVYCTIAVSVSEKYISFTSNQSPQTSSGTIMAH